jgi:DNA-binding SARP family transcriptional activator
MPIELRLLGRVGLSGAPGPESHLAQSKLLGLLAWLALAAGGGLQRRDRVVGLLWPELDQGHARAALRKALHALRQLLGPGAIATRGDEELGLHRGVVWCDATEFRDAADGNRLDHALELYVGELLPGFHLPGCAEYQQWLDEQRAEFRERAGAAAWALALHYEKETAYTRAGDLARKAARFMWENERVLRRSLEMLERIGDRAGALTLYGEFVKRLRQELDVDPSDETRRLAERLRTGAAART